MTLIDVYQLSEIDLIKYELFRNFHSLNHSSIHISTHNCNSIQNSKNILHFPIKGSLKLNKE